MVVPPRAAPLRGDVGAGPPLAELGISDREVADELGETRVLGLARRLHPQVGDDRARELLPLRIQRTQTRVGEQQPDKVPFALRDLAEVDPQRGGKRVPGRRGSASSRSHASKHGVLGLTKSAALEYAPRGIRINAVCPGTIDTPMVADMLAKGELDPAEAVRNQPIGRLGTADEIAAAVLWLCSPAASFVVGVALPVDGGYTAA
jgi:hypothetical protein